MLSTEEPEKKLKHYSFGAEYKKELKGNIILRKTNTKRRLG